MLNKYIFYLYILISCVIASIFVSCDKSPTSGISQSEDNLIVTLEINVVSSSPLRGIGGTVHWKSADNYIYAKKAALNIEPPSDIRVSDIPDDQGHWLRLAWTLSPSENDGLVAWYRIYRSRSQTLTEPKPMSEFSSIEDLIDWEKHSTVLIDSVAAGTSEYEDFVPLSGVIYYYWLQAVGTIEEPSVTGIVTDKDGNPVSGVLLRLYNSDESIDINAISRSDGSYAFYDVPQGEYYLVAKRDDYQIFSTPVTVP